MKTIPFLNPPPLFVEISQNSLKAVHGNNGVELPLERHSDGRLTAPGREKIVAALKDFLKAKSWQPRARAWCAISSRGVSLRRLSLPGGTKEEFHSRLMLQIEGEFPLPPDELAWGSQPLGAAQASNGVMARQDLLVAAVKKEVLADYHELLRACGTEPVFTLAALARRNICGRPADAFAMLDIGASQSELTVFEKNVPVSSRIVFWGSETKTDLTNGTPEALAQAIGGSVAGKKLFVSGEAMSESRLTAAFGRGCQCERLAFDAGSAAIAGLQKFAEQGGGPPLLLRLEQTSGTAASFADLDWKKWGTRVGALAAAVLLLPYAEALLLKPHLAKEVAAFKTEAARLTVIDRELDFLRALKASQPPYLDELFILSKSMPPGTKFDALSLNSHGEVSLRGAFRDGQQVADFRAKLIASGFFANVTVEEQVPTPDRQKVNVRISAQEKPTAQLLALAASLPAEETPKDGKPSAPGAKPAGASSVATNAPPVLRKETK